MEAPIFSSQTRIDRLQNEIDVFQGHLENLDEGDDDYNARRMMLEIGLDNLKDQLHEAGQHTERTSQDETGDGSSAANGGNSLPTISNLLSLSDATMKPPTGFASYAGSSHDTSGSTPSWDFGSIDGSAISPDATNIATIEDHSASGSPSSPDSGFLRPQKRQRKSSGLNDFLAPAAKSMRTTPSPAGTGMTTPSSIDSFEFPDNPELLNKLFGGNPKEQLREMRAAETLLEAKKEQERADAALAELLSSEEQENNFVSARGFSRSGPSRPGPNALPQTTSQTYLDSEGRYGRPAPQSSSPLPIFEDPFSTSFLPVKQESGYHPVSNNAPVKRETSYYQQPSRLPSHDIIDLCNDEEEEGYDQFNVLANHPSSDLVEIDAQAFGGNNRLQGTSAGSYNPYGNSGGSASSCSYTAPQFGQSLVNGAQSMYNSAVHLVNRQIAGYGSTPFGFSGTSGYDDNGLGSPSFASLSSYDQSQTLANSVFGLHGLNAEDPANRELYDAYIDRVNYVTSDPTRTTAEIKSLLENIRPDEELPPENREGTPAAMFHNLMEHQKLGLTWMKAMEEGSNKGGILADDMGLGKTVQAIALMVSRKSDDKLRKTTLVVCPVGLLRQWEKEINDKLKPGQKLKVYVLHGEKRHVKWETLRTFDVVLTTFGTLGTEYKRREGVEMKKRANPNWIPTSKDDYLPLLGEESKWYRVIIDEAQCIKNKSTKAAMGASLLHAVHRFCMTGTPMQNNIDELYSLIRFLRIKPYCEAEKFRDNFSRPLKGQSDVSKTRAMKRLQAFLKAILLRRTKKSQIDGKPILNLPERTTVSQHAAFSDDEHAFYQALETRTQLQFNKFLKAGTVGKHYSNILVLLLRLRQACCHPHLIRDFGQASGSTEVSPETMMKLAKELAPDVVARIKEQSCLNDDCALECPVCMDMTDNSTIFIPCGHNTCSECFARISDPSQAIADGNGVSNAVKCPNCRGTIEPSKVIDHHTFKKVHMPEKIADALEEELPEDAETTDNSDSDEDSYDGDDGNNEEVDSKGNLKDFVVDNDVVDDASETEDEEGEGYNPGQTPFEKSKKNMKREKSKKGKGKALDKPPRKTLAQLKKEGARNAQSRRRYLKRLNKDWIPSAKTEKTMDILRAIQDRKGSEAKQCEKTIIFSQFTSLLDLLEIPIASEGWKYTRYDGSMSANARNEAVEEFQDQRKNCTILLVSLKAGNSGLNLIAASQVIMLDPFWNPYIEEQAIDRAHRIGQQKPVQVYRVIVQNTVEDRILALQEKKRELIEAALDENASKSISRLGVRELGFLFDVPT